MDNGHEYERARPKREENLQVSTLASCARHVTLTAQLDTKAGTERTRKLGAQAAIGYLPPP